MKLPAEKFYSKTDLAEHFCMPESTIRFYCERFAPYLELKGQGRKRRYAPSSLEVIEFIRIRMPNLRTSREMDTALAERFPILTNAPAKTQKFQAPQPGAQTTNRVLQLLERQTKALERIADNLDKLDLADAPSSTAKDPGLEALRSEIRDLRFLVKGTEKTQQEDMEQIRGLIMRLAKNR